VGETGSGKSTQLPKICLGIGRGTRGLIGHTQPRRIAARSIAARISAELGVEPGSTVGYKIRFSDRVSRDTCIKVMTDGILLAELESDRSLSDYDTLIVDEAHERSLNIDFLLGYMKRLLKRRHDLKLIITSATIDPSGFARFFDGAPVVEVPGKSFPVEIRYRPATVGEGRIEPTIAEDIAETIRNLESDKPGDVLVFLPGEKEISTTAKLLKRLRLPQTECVPLYARLSVEEQQKIFQPHHGRRIILATNVAETSLTVPDIVYVVDSGLARISRYRPDRQIQSLPIEPVSRASADQRKGRCGRTAAGVCIRLYSEDDLESRPPFTPPEILRTSLASVILRMKALGLGDIDSFPFMDPPGTGMVKDGYRLLEELGAVTGEHKLTRSGRRLAKLPVDPRLGRMLLESARVQCTREMLVICAALSVQDPRLYPEHAREDATGQHSRFQHPDSDFVSILKLWDTFQSETGDLGRRQRLRYCRERFLSPARMREWRDVHGQLDRVRKRLGLTLNSRPADYKRIHRAVLTGLLGNIATRQQGREYLGTRGKVLSVHPTSATDRKLPGWIVCAEMVDTTRLYARTIARVEPGWIESAAAGLTKKSYAEPRWSARRGRVIAIERVTLYGLVIIAGRDVDYGPLDPVESRKIFIAEALVTGRLGREFPFQQHNARLMSEVERLEHKSRRRDILVDEIALYDHFDRLLAEGVCDIEQFSNWYEKASTEDPEILYLTKEALMRHPAEAVTTERFPPFLDFENNRLKCRYHFEPGHPGDGVTVRIPHALLPYIRPDSFSWLVPGLLLEKVTALIRSLPKTLRKNFIPAGDFALKSFDLLDREHGSLTRSLAMALEQLTGVSVSDDDWNEAGLPDHLRMNFEVLDPEGGVAACGRCIESLRSALSTQPQPAAAAHTPEPGIERTGIKTWDFGDLPQKLAVGHHGLKLTVYPALTDEADSVAIRTFDQRRAAMDAHRIGLRRLLALQIPDHVRRLYKSLPGIDRMCLNFASIGSCECLRRDLVDAALDEVLEGGVDDENIRTEESFGQRVIHARSTLGSVVNDLCALAAQSLEAYRNCINNMEHCTEENAADISGQLQGLIYERFVSATPAQYRRHLPRYLAGILVRIERSRHAPEKDERCIRLIEPFERRLADRAGGPDDDTPALIEYRWLLEEYRISLFAQELGTAVPVSPKRLDRKWAQLNETRKD